MNHSTNSQRKSAHSYSPRNEKSNFVSTEKRAEEVLNAIESLLAEECPPEKRRFPRHLCAMAYRIIPIQMNRQNKDRLRPIWVRCNDLSQNGFSFYLRDKLDFELMILEFCNNGKENFILAEVVSSDKIPSPPSGPTQDSSGRKHIFCYDVASVLVRCKFLRRFKNAELLTSFLS